MMSTNSLQIETSPIKNNPPLKQKLVEMVLLRSKRTLVIISLVIITIISLGTLFFIYKNRWSQKLPGKNIPSNTSGNNIVDTIEGQFVLLKLKQNFQVKINKNWNVEIVELSEKHSFIKVKENNVFVEIEAFSADQEELEKYLLDPLFTKTSEESKVYTNVSVRTETGKENFASSDLYIIKGIWERAGDVLTVRCKANREALAKTFFEDFAKQVSFIEVSKSQSEGMKFLFSRVVYANEDLFVNCREIEIMSPLFEDEITNKDMSYKGGFVKCYKFLAFKSQNLTAAAFEIEGRDKGSYVRSQVFDFEGNEVSDEKDTRVEFTAPHTGYYYYLVSTFQNKEGKINVGINDRDRTDVKLFVKYPDGAELRPGNSLIGNFEVALLWQMPRIVTVSEDNILEYEYIVEFEPPSPRKTQIKYFMAKDFLKRRGGGVSTLLSGHYLSLSATEEEKYRIDINIIQLNANTIMIIPKNDNLFPSGHRIWYEEEIIEGKYCGLCGGVLFTQEEKIVNIPILVQLATDFPDKFYPSIKHTYFDWMSLENTIQEVEGGYIEFKGEGWLAIDLFKDYFINKGYIVDQPNTVEGIIGLIKQDNICQIQFTNTFGSDFPSALALGIFCGRLIPKGN